MKIDGMLVVEAKSPITLNITKRDIGKGAAKDPRSCAAAKAARRMFPAADEVRVHLSRLYVRTGKKWTRYKVADGLRTEIIAFDRGGSFEAGEYMLRPSPPSQRHTPHNASQAKARREENNGQYLARMKKSREKPRQVKSIRPYAKIGCKMAASLTG